MQQNVALSKCLKTQVKKIYHIQNGISNEAFSLETISNTNSVQVDPISGSQENNNDVSTNVTHERAQWSNNTEFLMSCIAMSVGLGNIWRFPFTAYENGGGAFLIPYIIILIVVGKPFYLLEMILGQFSSRSAIKIWAIAPAFKGIGIAQFITLLALTSYYCSLMAMTLFYLVVSFQSELPWGKCKEEWGEYCVNSQKGNDSETSWNGTSLKNVTYLSSAELYFYKEVLHEKANIDDGIGLPDWRLTIGLLVSWLTIFITVIRGIKSSGKAAYFMAITPYVVMLILLIRAVTLSGSTDGILYFITPDWNKLWTSSIWYNAVAQCFFSLTVCFGAVVMFASHNKIDHDIYRDVMIVTTLDTFTSFLAGCTIFAILGNLSYELGAKDISKVVRGGTGLAFISYPETIVKFDFLPQFFAIVFFLMIFILGIGSEVGLTSSIISIVHDQFPGWKEWHIAAGTCFFEFLIGLIYVTPGGQYMVTFVDYYATSFLAFLPAIFEMIAVSWCYGINNFLDDVEFMLNRRLSIYWKVCWSFLTPAIILVIFIYSMINLKLLTYNDLLYPNAAYVIGWVLFSIAVLQIPLWVLIAIFKKRHLPFREMIIQAFQPSKNWSPMNAEAKRKWLEFKEHR